jgi:hypothetical protein
MSKEGYLSLIGMGIAWVILKFSEKFFKGWN